MKASSALAIVVGIGMSVGTVTTLSALEVCDAGVVCTISGTKRVCTFMNDYTQASATMTSMTGNATYCKALNTGGGMVQFIARRPVAATPMAKCVITAFQMGYPDQTCTIDDVNDNLPVELMEFSVDRGEAEGGR